jgi:hypothetical protein
MEASPAHFSAFKNLDLSGTSSSVLTVRFDSDSSPATLTGHKHTDFPRALYETGEDRDIRMLVLTRTGDVPGDGIRIAREKALGLRSGAVAEALPLDLLSPAGEVADTLAVRPALLSRYPDMTLRRRVSRRMAEGAQFGMDPQGPDRGRLRSPRLTCP